MLDFIRDIYASFRQASLERVKSPALGAFVFSWIGFNWQAVAILFFSKITIEKRIELINLTSDVGNYLLAPICTTALICFLLPRINKLVTRIQDKPNSETVKMTLSAKIEIAELQQKIAELDAQKKLAEKKEEREIEEGIKKIKDENEIFKNDITSLQNRVHSLDKQIASHNTESTYLKHECERLINEKNKLLQEIKDMHGINEALKKENNSLSNEIHSSKKQLDATNSTISDLQKQASKYSSNLKQLQKNIIVNQEKESLWAINFPEYFKKSASGNHERVEITEKLISDYQSKYPRPDSNNN